MSVEEQLGVADLAQGLAEARQLREDWVGQDSRLASAPAVDGLRDWLMLVGIDAADEALHALVQIGSPSGGDCRPAAWVVAWALLPGAIAVARQAPAGPETDALVASQLWLEQVSPSEELSDVLSWGEQVGLIGSGDRLLLCSLVEHTDRLAVRTVCRGGQGLKSRQGAQIAHPGPNCGSMLRADAVRHLPLQWLPRAIHRGIECLRVSLRATLIHAVTPIHLFP